MGIITNGIFGGFSKKTGALVGIRLGNLNVIRSLPLKSAKKPTAAQKKHRANFGQISALLSCIKPLVDLGYAKKVSNSAAMNRAIKINMQMALIDHGTATSIDFTKLSFSEGNLRLPDNVNAEALSAQLINFTWAYHDYEDKWKAADDLCTLLLYNETKQVFCYAMNAANRSDGLFQMTVPSFASGDVLYAYLSVKSAFYPYIKSKSVYINNFTMP